jgi:hypothetical protein
VLFLQESIHGYAQMFPGQYSRQGARSTGSLAKKTSKRLDW